MAHIVDYIGVTKGDTRSLDYSTHTLGSMVLQYTIRSCRVLSICLPMVVPRRHPTIW